MKTVFNQKTVFHLHHLCKKGLAYNGDDASPELQGVVLALKTEIQSFKILLDPMLLLDGKPSSSEGPKCVLLASAGKPASSFPGQKELSLGQSYPGRIPNGLF